MPHFSLDEFTRSRIAQENDIDNTPPQEVRAKLLLTMAGMERIRSFLGYPIKIHSGYRCRELNELIGGSKNSQHMKGEACDFTCPGFSIPLGVAKELSQNIELLGIDQLILEPSWVHVSFSLTPRHEVLTAKFGKYIGGIG